MSPTQGSNPGLPHCRRILYHLSHQGSPRFSELLITFPYCVCFYLFACCFFFFVSCWPESVSVVYNDPMHPPLHIMNLVTLSFQFLLQNALDLFIPYHILMQMLAFVLMKHFFSLLLSFQSHPSNPLGLAVLNQVLAPSLLGLFQCP